MLIEAAVGKIDATTERIPPFSVRNAADLKAIDTQRAYGDRLVVSGALQYPQQLASSIELITDRLKAFPAGRRAAKLLSDDRGALGPIAEFIPIRSGECHATVSENGREKDRIGWSRQATLYADGRTRSAVGRLEQECISVAGKLLEAALANTRKRKAASASASPTSTKTQVLPEEIYAALQKVDPERRYFSEEEYDSMQLFLSSSDSDSDMSTESPARASLIALDKKEHYQPEILLSTVDHWKMQLEKQLAAGRNVEIPMTSKTTAHYDTSNASSVVPLGLDDKQQARFKDECNNASHDFRMLDELQRHLAIRSTEFNVTSIQPQAQAVVESLETSLQQAVFLLSERKTKDQTMKWTFE